MVKRRRLKNEVLWGPPAVHGNRAFVGNEAGQILCIDTTTLDDAWLQRLEGPVRGHVATTDLRLIACTASGAVHVLDAETGGVLSKTLVGGKTEDGPCALPDGGFVIVTRRGNATRFDSRAHVVWRYDAGEDVTASPQLIDGKVILVTRHGVVISLTP